MRRARADAFVEWQKNSHVSEVQQAVDYIEQEQGDVEAKHADATAKQSQVATDAAQVAADKIVVDADKQVVAADKVTVAADKVAVQSDRVATETAAASAASVMQQDLSALIFDIPAGVVAITPIDPHKHGFVTWPVHGDQSWRSEAPSTGAYLGVAADETAARAISGAADGDHYWNSTDKKVYELAVTSGQTEVFRAGSANFPPGFALAIGSYVYLLDNSSTKHIWRVEDLTGYTIQALAFVSGQIWIGTTAGVIVLDYATGETTVAVKYDTTTTPAIVHNTVNAVAATVLPDAPIKNGVPVPTIAVATGGGVSVIKDDGSAVSQPFAYKMTGVAFDAANDLLLWGTPDHVLRKLGYPYNVVGSMIAEAFANTTVLPSLSASASWRGIKELTVGDAMVYVTANYAVAPLATLWHNPSDVNASLVAYQADQFTTPPMFGDVKGAFLCEQGQAGTITTSSPDRSVNGNDLTIVGSLTQDVDGWVSGFSATDYLEQPYNSGLDAGTDAFQRHLRLKMNANTATETVFERDSATSAQRETLTVTAAGVLSYTVDDGTTVRTATGTVAIDDSTEHDVIVGYDGAGGVFIKLDSEDYASATGAALLTMTNTAAVMRIGLDVAGANPLTNGSVRRMAPEGGNTSANQNKVKAAWIGDNVAGTFQDMWFDPQTKLQHVLTDTYYYVLDENGAILSDKTEPNTGSWTKLAASPFGVVRAA